MAVGTTLSRLTGFGRVLALVYALGQGRLSDAYTLANTAPNILYDLVLGGVLSATLVPVFVSHLEAQDEDDGWTAVSAVFTVATVVVVLLSVIFVVLAPAVIRLYTLLNNTPSAGPQRAVASTLLRWFAPQIALLGIITLSTAVLNARRRFAVPMFVPVANNLVAIAALVATPHVARSLDLGDIRHDPRALALLGAGTTAGYLVQAVLQWPAMRRAGARLRFVWNLRHDAVRAMLRLSGWTFGFVITNQVAFFVVLLLAERIDGGVTAYSSAYLFFQLPYAILAVSVMTALQPEMASRWTADDIEGFRDQVGIGLRLTFAVLIPATVGYALLARPLIVLVLQHGRMSHANALLTADTLTCISLGLPMFSAYLLLIRAYQAMQDARTPFWLYLVENGTNVVVAIAVFSRYGVQGLGVALAVAYTVGAGVALFDLRRRLAGLQGGHLLSSVVRSAAASAVMGVAVWAVSRAIGPGGYLHLGIRVVAAVAVGVAVYAASARVLGSTELSSLLRFRRADGGV